MSARVCQFKDESSADVHVHWGSEEKGLACSPIVLSAPTRPQFVSEKSRAGTLCLGPVGMYRDAEGWCPAWHENHRYVRRNIGSFFLLGLGSGNLK